MEAFCKHCGLILRDLCRQNNGSLFWTLIILWLWLFVHIVLWFFGRMIAWKKSCSIESLEMCRLNWKFVQWNCFFFCFIKSANISFCGCVQCSVSIVNALMQRQWRSETDCQLKMNKWLIIPFFPFWFFFHFWKWKKNQMTVN